MEVSQDEVDGSTVIEARRELILHLREADTRSPSHLCTYVGALLTCAWRQCPNMLLSIVSGDAMDLSCDCQMLTHKYVVKTLR
jgi:hypothetical protein